MISHMILMTSPAGYMSSNFSSSLMKSELLCVLLTTGTARPVKNQSLQGEIRYQDVYIRNSVYAAVSVLWTKILTCCCYSLNTWLFITGNGMYHWLVGWNDNVAFLIKLHGTCLYTTSTSCIFDSKSGSRLSQ